MSSSGEIANKLSKILQQKYITSFIQRWVMSISLLVLAVFIAVAEALKLWIKKVFLYWQKSSITLIVSAIHSFKSHSILAIDSSVGSELKIDFSFNRLNYYRSISLNFFLSKRRDYSYKNRLSRALSRPVWVEAS